MKVPTTKTIMQRLTWLEKVGDPKTIASQVRKDLLYLASLANAGFCIHPKYKDVARVFAALNSLLDTHGIEYIACRQDDQHSTRGITYLNTGDTYTPTVCYNHKTGTISITSWGDIVERHPSRYE